MGGGACEHAGRRCPRTPASCRRGDRRLETPPANLASRRRQGRQLRAGTGGPRRGIRLGHGRRGTGHRRPRLVSCRQCVTTRPPRRRGHGALSSPPRERPRRDASRPVVGNAFPRRGHLRRTHVALVEGAGTRLGSSRRARGMGLVDGPSDRRAGHRLIPASGDAWFTGSVVFIMAFLGGAIASIAGFGIGSVLTPVLALWTGTKV